MRGHLEMVDKGSVQTAMFRNEIQSLVLMPS